MVFGSETGESGAGDNRLNFAMDLVLDRVEVGLNTTLVVGP